LNPSFYFRIGGYYPDGEILYAYLCSTGEDAVCKDIRSEKLTEFIIDYSGSFTQAELDKCKCMAYTEALKTAYENGITLEETSSSFQFRGITSEELAKKEGYVHSVIATFFQKKVPNPPTTDRYCVVVKIYFDADMHVIKQESNLVKIA